MAREVIGTNIELAIFTLVNGLVANVPSKYLCYTHSTGLLSTFVREDSFHSGQQLMERFIKKLLKIRTELSVLSGVSISSIPLPLPVRFREHHKRGSMV